MTDTKPEQKTQLEPSRFKLAEHVFNTHAAICEPGVTREDVLRTDFWSHNARKMQVHDKIIVTTDDGAIYGELLVVARDMLWAKVHVLRWDSLVTRDMAETEAVQRMPGEGDYDIQWKGNHLKHVVIRRSDSSIMHKGEQRLEDARLWLREHLKAVTT